MCFAVLVRSRSPGFLGASRKEVTHSELASEGRPGLLLVACRHGSARWPFLGVTAAYCASCAANFRLRHTCFRRWKPCVCTAETAPLKRVYCTPAEVTPKEYRLIGQAG